MVSDVGLSDELVGAVPGYRLDENTPRRIIRQPRRSTVALAVLSTLVLGAVLVGSHLLWPQFFSSLNGLGLGLNARLNLGAALVGGALIGIVVLMFQIAFDARDREIRSRMEEAEILRRNAELEFLLGRGVEKSLEQVAVAMYPYTDLSSERGKTRILDVHHRLARGLSEAQERSVRLFLEDIDRLYPEDVGLPDFGRINPFILGDYLFILSGIDRGTKIFDELFEWTRFEWGLRTYCEDLQQNSSILLPSMVLTSDPGFLGDLLNHLSLADHLARFLSRDSDLDPFQTPAEVALARPKEVMRLAGSLIRSHAMLYAETERPTT